MTEISYITQNGQQVNLKDAAGREMLATKQPKLKAGKGINIAADGTISSTSGREWKDYRIDNVYVENGSANATFSAEFVYKGNIALLNSVIPGTESDGEYRKIEGQYSDGILGGVYNISKEAPEEELDTAGVDLSSTNYVQSSDFFCQVFGYMRDNVQLEDTGEDYLYIVTKKVSGISESSYSQQRYIERDNFLIFKFADTGYTTVDDNSGKTYKNVLGMVIGARETDKEEDVDKGMEPNCYEYIKVIRSCVTSTTQDQAQAKLGSYKDILKEVLLTL